MRFRRVPKRFRRRKSSRSMLSANTWEPVILVFLLPMIFQEFDNVLTTFSFPVPVLTVRNANCQQQPIIAPEQRLGLPSPG